MVKHFVVYFLTLCMLQPVLGRKRCLVSSKTTLLYYERIQSVTIWADDLKDANKKFRKIFPHRTNVMRIKCREHINPYEKIQ
tara:strand:+ start:173 stop:418 length:246 start_codon:yes stop_codon:yes gene_type:complete